MRKAIITSILVMQSGVGPTHWAAWRDGEENRFHGVGPTEGDAVADLLRMELNQPGVAAVTQDPHSDAMLRLTPHIRFNGGVLEQLCFRSGQAVWRSVPGILDEKDELD